MTESGLYSLFVENIFTSLEGKRAGILEDLSNLNNVEAESTAFSYNVRMKFVEFKDEIAVDLLQKYNYYKQPVQVVIKKYKISFIQKMKVTLLLELLGFLCSSQ